MFKSRKRLKSILVLIALLFSAVGASGQEPNLLKKWSYSAPQAVGGSEVSDINTDGRAEVIVGTVENNFIVLDGYGNMLSGFYLGNASTIGRVFSMSSGDLDGNSVNELVIGTGGAKVVNTYPIRGYDVEPGVGIIENTMSLYRTIRYYGGVYAVRASGFRMWNYSDVTSVRCVYSAQLNNTPGFNIIAGLGDQNTNVYAVHGTMDYSDNYCTTENFTHVVMGWSEKEVCEDSSVCCSGLEDCSCSWNSAEELCYGSYSKMTCDSTAGSDSAWVFKEYPDTNGTVVLLNGSGKVEGSYIFGSQVVGGMNNNIRAVYAADIDSDGQKEIIAGLSNRNVSVLKYSNGYLRKVWFYDAGSEVRVVSAGKMNEEYAIFAGTNDGFIIALSKAGSLLWKYRLSDVVTGINVADLEGDEINDIIVSSRDRNIYVFNQDGSLRWKYFAGVNLYSLKVVDIDNNGLVDMIVSTTYNVTRYELSEFYVKKNKADSFYNRAYSNYNNNDFTSAMVYVSKAQDLYSEIGDKEGAPKAKVLEEKIRNGILLAKLREADRNYELALRYYASNDLDTAVAYANRAKATYTELKNNAGVANADSLLSQIDIERKNRKKFEADAYYSRALTFDTFGNFTAALDNIKAARKIYAEIDYFDGTAKCDTLSISIADKNYDSAVASFNLMNYNRSLYYALAAKEIYSTVGYYNGSAKAEILVNQINEAIAAGSRRKEDKGPDYFNYALGLAAVAAVLIAIILLRKKPQYAEKELVKEEPLEPSPEEPVENSTAEQSIREEVRKELK